MGHLTAIFCVSISILLSSFPGVVVGDALDNTISDDTRYQIGIGIGDITGPAAEVNMMGYAKFGQDTSGIHFRLYARTFIIEDTTGSRIVYVSCDTAMIDQIITTQVITSLKSKYNGLYGVDNVLLTGTHTHSTPGGFLQYLLYTIASQGFTKQTFDGMVDGILRSIDRAHHNMTPGYLYWNEGQLLNASINRSPTAYLNNSADERSLYQHDTDKDVYVIKMTNQSGSPIGMINWFAVHPTSMNNTNTLISGDNKGYASMLFEQHINGLNSLPGKGPFVAAFSSSNLGDVSPNLDGPKCMDTGEPCDISQSTCNGKPEMCFASGPGKDMFESTKIIAERQVEKVMELFNSAKTPITGSVKFIHQHIDMTRQVFTKDGVIVNTCKPAMGYSFAAGTVDGPGAFDFKQGTTTPNKFWNAVRDFLAKPSKEMMECHAPKPILLATGLMKFPYAWQPSIVPTQVMKIGNVLMAAVPGEFTTMSGRRMKNMIRTEAKLTTGRDDYHVVLSGLANAYSSYVATFEEYQIQRYEGASTIFGPYTLDAYLNQYKRLTNKLLNNMTTEPGPDPPFLLKKQISFRPGVVFDSAPIGKKFGQCVQQPDDVYKVNQTARCTFISGHPRNNLMQEESFLLVEKLVNSSTTPSSDGSSWAVVATDANLDTKFIWKRTNPILGTSIAQMEWTIPPHTEPATYRIRHFGSYKSVFQKIYSFEGVTNLFKVVPETF